MSLVSSLFGVFSSWMVIRICAVLGSNCLGWSKVHASRIGVLVALAFALTQAVWFQSVRPEVYTLQTALNLAVLYSLLRASVAGETRIQLMYFWSATFALGLGGINHHYLALFTIPSGLLLLLKKRLPFLKAAILPGLFLSSVPLTLYAFLPLRAAQNPYINWVNPDSWDRVLDVVLARVFQGSVTDHPGSRNGLEPRTVVFHASGTHPPGHVSLWSDWSVGDCKKSPMGSRHPAGIPFR